MDKSQYMRCACVCSGVCSAPCLIDVRILWKNVQMYIVHSFKRPDGTAYDRKGASKKDRKRQEARNGRQLTSISRTQNKARKTLFTLPYTDCLSTIVFQPLILCFIHTMCVGTFNSYMFYVFLLFSYVFFYRQLRGFSVHINIYCQVPHIYKMCARVCVLTPYTYDV